MDGLNKFKEYFADYTDNYVVIGGVACGLYADLFTQNPRVTHDIDTVLVVEALTRDFAAQFWPFLKDAGYGSINPVYNINGKYIYAGYSSINPVYNFVTR